MILANLLHGKQNFKQMNTDTNINVEVLEQEFKNFFEHWKKKMVTTNTFPSELKLEDWYIQFEAYLDLHSNTIKQFFFIKKCIEQ